MKDFLGGGSFLGGREEGLGEIFPLSSRGEVMPRVEGIPVKNKVFSGQVFVDVCYYRTLVVTNPLYWQGIVKAEPSTNVAFCSPSHLKL